MQHTFNPNRPLGTTKQGPRTSGGLLAYLLLIPLFVVLLAAPGVAVAMFVGGFSAVVAQKLRSRRLREDQFTPVTDASASC